MKQLFLDCFSYFVVFSLGGGLGLYFGLKIGLSPRSNDERNIKGPRNSTGA